MNWPPWRAAGIQRFQIVPGLLAEMPCANRECGGRRELIPSALRSYHHASCLKDFQHRRPAKVQLFGDFAAGLSGLVRLDRRCPQPVRDALALSRGRRERQGSLNLSNTIWHACQQCVRTESSQGSDSWSSSASMAEAVGPFSM